MSSVRQATLDDKPAIAQFLQVAYPDRHQYKFPERWEWQFESNPFCDGNMEKLPLWLAFDGERIVGQTGAQLEPMKLGDKSVRVGWSVDTYVLPDYRGQGIGRGLQQANQAHHQVFMSLAMSDGNRHIKTSLGATALSPVEVYELRVSVPAERIRERLRSSTPALAPLASGVGLDRLAAKATTAVAEWRWRRSKAKGLAERYDPQKPGFSEKAGFLSRKAIRNRAVIREIERFDERFDALWSKARGGYEICVERTPRYLNWKFTDQPHAVYGRFAALVNDAVVGYVVLRVCSPPEPPLGVIVDLVTEDNDETVCRELLVFAVEQLRQAGVEKVRVATTLDGISRTLQSLSFRRTRTYTPMCHVREEPRAKSEESRAESDSQSSLATRDYSLPALDSGLSAFFSLGDHDLDQFPRRR